MPAPIFRNTYDCPCGRSWADEWCAQCDDECAACGRQVSPTTSTLTGARCDHPDCGDATLDRLDAPAPAAALAAQE